MLLIDGIAGRAKNDREILYDGEVCLLEENRGRVLGVTSCYVYELQFRTYRPSDPINLEVNFLAELVFEYLDEGGARASRIKKLSCRKILHPGLGALSEKIKENDKLFLIPVARDMTYRYSLAASGKGIRLTICASMEYFATASYYTSIFECAREQPEPGMEHENINWRMVYDHVRFDDALACLEHMIRLIKINRIFGDDEKGIREQDGTREREMVENRKLTELNMSLREEVAELRATAARLRSELKEKEEIISKLLALLDKTER